MNIVYSVWTLTVLDANITIYILETLKRIGMATIKSYTDIEQSKVLAKILPIESADMWHHGFFNPNRMCKIEYNPPAPYHSVTPQWDCPCWSLTALLNVLPYPSLHKTFSGWRCDSYNKEGTSCILGEPSDNQVDTCYELILKLHELNLL